MAKFSKKHYEVIAKALNAEIKKAKGIDKALKDKGINSNRGEGIKDFMHTLVNVFDFDNVNFKSEKFIDKCLEA